MLQHAALNGAANRTFLYNEKSWPVTLRICIKISVMSCADNKCSMGFSCKFPSSDI